MSRDASRKYSQGPECVDGGVDFRIWAPERRQVELILDGAADPTTMHSSGDGYWSLFVPGLAAGARYGFRVDGGQDRLADPASRLQPEGPHGWSQVVDGARFPWSDQAWRGVRLPRQVLYELHAGTFSAEGTWQGALAHLPRLRDLGVTVVELMPVAEFAGRCGWGYDAVALYAPSHLYGTPDELRRFVDTAHALGLAVILDVIYNHLGPDGTTLHRFSAAYFSSRETEWGRALNFDGPDCEPARRFVSENAAYWIAEFHLDGLRLDATQNIYDSSSEHIVTALTRAARVAAAGREIIVVAENEPQDARLLGMRGLDGLWNDDFHHSAVVALTGRREGYYSEYLGNARELCAAATCGFLFQGQLYRWQGKRRGQSMRGQPGWVLINYLENHDQLANSLRGARVWQQAGPARHRVLTAYLLLGPWTPLLFQGQEWNASAPFLYFADHSGELGEKVRQGRAEFLRQFPSLRDCQALLPDPADPRTCEACRLDWREREQEPHARALALHRDLLALRREDATLSAPQQGGLTCDAVALAPGCWLLRYFGRVPASEDRLLICNLGTEIALQPAPEPLLAPPAGQRWRVLWSSEEPRYGGAGVVCPEDEAGGWNIGGQSAVLLQPTKDREGRA